MLILSSIRKLVLPSLLFLVLQQTVIAQRVTEVLENGKVIPEDKYLFLSTDGSKLSYDIRIKNEAFHWNGIEKDDKPIFLSKASTVSVLLLPVNPLNISYSSSLFFTTNTIDSAAASAMQDVMKFFKTYIDPTALATPCDAFQKLVSLATTIQDKFKDDQKQKINEAFGKLKAMHFTSKQETVDEITTIKTGYIDKITAHYKDIDDSISKLDNLISTYDDHTQGCTEPYIVKYIFSQIREGFNKVKDAQELRLTNLNKAFKLVTDAKDLAMHSRTGLEWVIDMPSITFQEGKISNYKVIINDAGYSLVDNEIVAHKEEEKVSIVLNVRKFQRFIPEVSAGVAYLNLSFPKYGTTTDASGKQIVSEAGEDNVRKINFTSMINWNYFANDTHINPFIQIGIGANAGYPSFLSGVGLRFHGLPNVPAFAFSCGLASTWVQSLDKLKVGDVVTGTADLEKDLKYKFNWPPKVYVGFQFQL
jgi:hypothetical protein